MEIKGTCFPLNLLLGWLSFMSGTLQVVSKEECGVNITELEAEIRQEMRGQLNAISRKQEDIVMAQKERMREFRILQSQLLTKLTEIETKTELALGNILNPDKNATEFFSNLNDVKSLVSSLGANVAAITPGPRNCKDVQLKRRELGHPLKNDIYGIFVKGKLVWAYCDFTNTGGNWTVIQKRLDNSTDFFREWNDFRDGFGHPGWNYWLGNDAVHEMTAVGNHTLRIDMKDFDNRFYFIEYHGFSLGNESEMYKLSLGGVRQGSVSDSLLIIHNGKEFGARDKFRNHGHCLNCPSYCHGGWWYECCYYSNLNGRLENGTHNVHEQARWYDFERQRYISMKQTEMKIRPEYDP